jgi:hypothetical protein
MNVVRIGIRNHLVDVAFHKLAEDGLLEEQGVFVTELGFGYFLACMRDFPDGEELHHRVFHLSAISDTHPNGLPVFRLFPNTRAADRYLEESGWREHGAAVASRGAAGERP